MTQKKRLIDPLSLAIRDNVPAGAVVSLAEIPEPVSFASIFRDELATRGIGLARKEVRRRANPD